MLSSFLLNILEKSKNFIKYILYKIYSYLIKFIHKSVINLNYFYIMSSLLFRTCNIFFKIRIIPVQKNFVNYFDHEFDTTN